MTPEMEATISRYKKYDYSFLIAIVAMIFFAGYALWGVLNG